ISYRPQLERGTGLEPATSTLGNFALPQKFVDQNEALASDKNPTEGEVGEVQRASRHELVRALAPRYGHVSKHEKSQILDQVCEVTGYTRKYALTLLKEPPDEPPVKASGVSHTESLEMNDLVAVHDAERDAGNVHRLHLRGDMR